MIHPSRRRQTRFVVETLEGRAMLSGAGIQVPAAIQSAVIGQIRSSAITTDPAGIAAIFNALRGGLGSEWTTLIRSQVRNIPSVVGRFISGQISAFSTNGFTVRTPAEQPQFVGQPYDQLLPVAAGAAVFRGNVVELGAIMRGPFHNPETSYYVFGLNRGAGGSLGPIFASKPGITPDMLVTLTVAPFGTSATGVVKDLTTGAEQAINPADIQIRGPVIRVFLNAGQFPSTGLPPQRYQFAFWTQTQPGNDITTVAGFAPDDSMIPIGIQRRIAARR